jgi:UDP-glucose 4-epimerase
MEKVNVELPRRLALAARAAGAQHMIHLSSFAVYGGQRWIARDVAPNPTNSYGRFKLAGDTTLQSLATASFAVTILRLPMVYAAPSLGKLGQMLKLWHRIRLLPTPAGDIARAMIGVELTAEVIVRLLAEPLDGIAFAADPRPFTYLDAANSRGGGLYRLPVPRAIGRLVERSVPSIGGRLFADSRLAAHDNLAVRYGLESQLYRDIAAANPD